MTIQDFKQKKGISANRIIVAVIVGILFIGIVLLSNIKEAFLFGLVNGRTIVSIILSAITIIAVIEMRRVIGFERIPHSMSWLVWSYAILFGPVYVFFGYYGIVFLSLLVFAGASLHAILINKAEVIFSFAFLLVYPGLLMSSLLYLNKCASTQVIDPNALVNQYIITDIWGIIHPTKVNYLLPYNSLGLALVFAISALTDVFAMLTGKFFGKKKLCPEISPKKTVEGAIGGIFGGLVGSFIVYFVYEILKLENIFGVGLWLQGLQPSYVMISYVLAGFFGSIMTQIGDLLASIIKRYFGVKDYGKLLGDHGGIMDRFDGIILNAGFIATIYMFII